MCYDSHCIDQCVNVSDKENTVEVSQLIPKIKWYVMLVPNQLLLFCVGQTKTLFKQTHNNVIF